MIDRRKLFGMAAGATLTMGGGAAAHPLPAAAREALDRLRNNRSTVGGVLAASLRGESVAAYAWGSASLTFDAPVTDRTLFHIGSNGKLMTAVAVLQLVEAGRATLEDEILRHLPELPASMSGVTIEHMLHQTSGLVDFPAMRFDWDRPQPRQAIVAALADRPVSFRPGESWAYCNTNYVLLGWLIEALSGQSYADYVQSRIFVPAGAPTARADAAQQVIPGRAEPYLVGDKGVRHAVRMEDEVSRTADGGLLFSALDLAPWTRALQSGRLLSPAGPDRIASPARLATGRLAPYGAGLFLQQTRGRRLWRHGGGVPGFLSTWFTWPDLGLSILAVVNSTGPDGAPLEDMVNTLADALVPGASWAGIEPVGDGSDSRTHRLRVLLSRGPDEPPPQGLLAEELSWMAADTLRISGIETLAPLETWRVGRSAREGEMVRYRMRVGGVDEDLTVGWTPDGRIYWGV